MRAQILTGTKESGRAEAPEKHRHRSVRTNGCKRVIFIEKGSQCVCQSVLQVLCVCIVETWFRDDLPTIGLAPSRKCFTNAASLCQSSMFGFGRPSNRLPFVSYFHFYEIVRSFKDMLQCTRIYWSLKKVWKKRSDPWSNALTFWKRICTDRSLWTNNPWAQNT